MALSRGSSMSLSLPLTFVSFQSPLTLATCALTTLASGCLDTDLRPGSFPGLSQVALCWLSPGS